MAYPVLLSFHHHLPAVKKLQQTRAPGRDYDLAHDGGKRKAQRAPGNDLLQVQAVEFLGGQEEPAAEKGPGQKKVLAGEIGDMGAGKAVNQPKPEAAAGQGVEPG